MVHPPAKGRNAARHPFFTATLDSIPAQQYAATRIPQHPLGGGFWGVGASAEKFRSKWFGGGGSAHLYGKVSALAAWLEVRPKTQPDLWRPRTPFAPPPPPVLSHVLTNTLRSGPRRRRRAWGTWPPNLSPRFPARPLRRYHLALADCRLHQVHPQPVGDLQIALRVQEQQVAPFSQPYRTVLPLQPQRSRAPQRRPPHRLLG